MNAINILVCVANFLIIKNKAIGALKKTKKESLKVTSSYIELNENNNIKKIKSILYLKNWSSSLLTFDLRFLYEI